MAAAPTLLSIDEYLRTSFRPDADYVDGEIEERNLGEFEHARLQYLLSVYFGSREKLWSIQGVVEQRIRVAERRVRIADFALLRADAPRERVTLTPPLLCVEILSPEDRMNRILRKASEYLEFGSHEVWIIDPGARRIVQVDALSTVERTEGTISLSGTPITFPLDRLFSALDRRPASK